MPISLDWLLLPAITFFCLGCQGSGSQEKAEFSRISRAIELLREADNFDKEAALEELQALGCQVHCELRARCIEAYTLHTEGLSLLVRARSLADPSSEEGGEVAVLLREAESKLRAARPKSQECAGLQSQLSRSIGR